jgi:hypothetical protein
MATAATAAASVLIGILMFISGVHSSFVAADRDFIKTTAAGVRLFHFLFLSEMLFRPAVPLLTTMINASTSSAPHFSYDIETHEKRPYHGA